MKFYEAETNRISEDTLEMRCPICGEFLLLQVGDQVGMLVNESHDARPAHDKCLKTELAKEFLKT